MVCNLDVLSLLCYGQKHGLIVIVDEGAFLYLIKHCDQLGTSDVSLFFIFFINVAFTAFVLVFSIRNFDAWMCWILYCISGILSRMFSPSNFSIVNLWLRCLKVSVEIDILRSRNIWCELLPMLQTLDHLHLLPPSIPRVF